MPEVVTQLLTLGDIARLEGVAAHRIAYAIERNRIQPDQRAGIIRLFGPDKLFMIRSSLRCIAKHKGE